MFGNLRSDTCLSQHALLGRVVLACAPRNKAFLLAIWRENCSQQLSLGRNFPLTVVTRSHMRLGFESWLRFGVMREKVQNSNFAYPLISLSCSCVSWHKWGHEVQPHGRVENAALQAIKTWQSKNSGLKSVELAKDATVNNKLLFSIDCLDKVVPSCNRFSTYVKALFGGLFLRRRVDN